MLTNFVPVCPPDTSPFPCPSPCGQSLVIKTGVGQRSILCPLGPLAFSSSFYDHRSPQGGVSRELLSEHLVPYSFPYWRKQDQKRKMRKEWDDYTSVLGRRWGSDRSRDEAWGLWYCDIVIYKKNVYLVIQATKIFLIYTWSLFKVSPSQLPRSLEFPKCWKI